MSNPIAYTIINERLNLYIAIRDIDSLHLHEETIPELLQQLAHTIEADGHVRNPIIVDKESLVVLDGMHRIAALEKLGAKRIPVCLIDYENPNVVVCSWYRTIADASGVNQILTLVVQAGNTVRKMSENKIGVSPVVAAIKFRSKTYVLYSHFQNMREAYDIIERVEELLEKNGFKIDHETEINALQQLRKGQVDAVICTPALSKKEIVESALSGQVFAHKTTRHVIPARPLGLNVPLNLLKDEKKSLMDVNEELNRMLQHRHLRRVQPGVPLNGRNSEEEFYVFEEYP